MAKDFAKRSKSRKKKPPPSRFSLGSFMAGVIVGVGLFLLGAYSPELLRNSPELINNSPELLVLTTPDDGSTAEPPAEPFSPDESSAPQTNATGGDLEFVFRDLLGAERVDPDMSAYEADVQSQRPQDPDTPMQYLLQSGSFQIKADAESRRGTLLLMNMPANIVEANIDNRVWYRVIVGPYAQRGKAQQAVTRLRANDISSIWLERPVT